MLPVILRHSPTLEPLKTSHCPRKQEFLCVSVSPPTQSLNPLHSISSLSSCRTLPNMPQMTISLDGLSIAISLGRVKKAVPVSSDHGMHASATPISTYTNIIYMDISQTELGLGYPSTLPPGIQQEMLIKHWLINQLMTESLRNDPKNRRLEN